MFLFSLLIISCKKDDDTTEPQSSNIKDEIATRADLTLLNLSLQKANLTSKFDSTGSFTIFAPTNDAFAASKIDANLIVRSSFISASIKQRRCLKYRIH